MPRLDGARQISRGEKRDTKSVALRAKNLKPIKDLLEWNELHTLHDESGTDQPLEFVPKVVHHAKR